MNADPFAVEVEKMGKMYKLYKSQRARMMDLLGIRRLLFQEEKYQKFWALRDVTFSVRKGERVGIIGHNGAGKSTLLKTLIGVQAPTEGKMRVHGRIQALMQLGTGFHPDFTGRENIRASLGYNNLSAAEIAAAEEEIIDFTELCDFIDQPVKAYSAGMYARLAFATATSIKPEILVIDEVLGAGDAYFSGKCVERMKRLSVESGATVLFVSHDLASVQNMCERCIWIDRGLLRADGPSLDVIKAYSAQVREREEMRLKIRNEKMNSGKKSLDVDYSKIAVFRFRSENGSDVRFSVSGLKILYQKQVLADLYPGCPMDCDETQPAFLYINDSSRGWTDVYSSGDSWRRDLVLNANAFALGGVLIQDSWRIEDFKFEITFLDSGKGNVLFEIYNGTDYVHAGTIFLSESQTKKIQTFCTAEPPAEQTNVPAAQTAEQSAEETPVSNVVDIYGSQECIIQKCTLLADGRETFLIPLRSPLKVRIDYEAYMDIPHPLFVFAVYLPCGECVTQMYHGMAPGEVLKKGKGTFSFVIDELLFGAGKYIASIAIFKRFPENGCEPPAYSLWDRKLEFEVFSDSSVENFKTGACLQKYTTILEQGTTES